MHIYKDSQKVVCLLKFSNHGRILQNWAMQNTVQNIFNKLEIKN